MDPTTSTPADIAPAAPQRLPRGPLLFCALLVAVGCVFLALTVRNLLAPPPPRAVPMGDYNVAEEAKKSLRQEKPAPLAGSLEAVLEEGKRVPFETDQHPLLGKVAPEFTRPDVDEHLWSLKDALKRGPVVIVFYLGYYCNHCVSQLFDVNEDLAHFRELGAEVVALSPDSRQTTLDRYREYGRFNFPVLSDHGNRVAQAYGVYVPAHDGKPEDLMHGTFVLDQNGVVRWARTGTAPFSRNQTLLYELAKIQGKAPK